MNIKLCNIFLLRTFLCHLPMNPNVRNETRSSQIVHTTFVYFYLSIAVLKEDDNLIFDPKSNILLICHVLKSNQRPFDIWFKSTVTSLF